MRLRNVDLSGTRIRSAFLRDVVITDGWLDDVRLEGEVRSLTVNGVDVTAYVEAELDRRHPERTRLRPEDVEGLRQAWVEAIEGARIRSAGRAAPHSEVRILDADGNEVPRGTVGEICSYGGHVMLGYWTGGEDVYSAEVEQAVALHPAVASCAVIGIPDPEWGEAVHAVVVLVPGATVTPEELREHCKAHIAGYKAPRSAEFVDALPINGAGKVLKRDLRAPYWEGVDRNVG